MRPTLRLGDEGEWVAYLQKWLMHNGTEFDPGPVDEKFGDKTEAAVRRFQGVTRVPPLRVDGIVGPKTWAALHDEPAPDPESADDIYTDTAAAARATRQLVEDIDDLQEDLDAHGAELDRIGAEIDDLIPQHVERGEVSVQSQAHQERSGEFLLTSDIVSYPDDIGRIGDTDESTRMVASFLSGGVATEGGLTFVGVTGHFSASAERADPTNRVLWGVHFTQTGGDDCPLVLHATFDELAGTGNDPVLRFLLTGRFDPGGIGDATFEAIVSVDQRGSATIASGSASGAEFDNNGMSFTIRLTTAV